MIAEIDALLDEYSDALRALATPNPPPLVDTYAYEAAHWAYLPSAAYGWPQRPLAPQYMRPVAGCLCVVTELDP